MATTETVCYKIRDRETGLWSAGGTEPRFNKTGKAWSSRGHLLNHLAQFTGYYYPPGYTKKLVRYIPNSWEVVTFKIVQDVSEGATIGAKEMYEKHKASK